MLEALWFWSETTYENQKHVVREGDSSKYFFDNFVHPFHNFTESVKKCLAFEAPGLETETYQI